jgi:hypothetical protein
MDKLTIAAAAWPHVIAAAGHAYHVTTVARGRLLPLSPTPVPETRLLPLFLRTREAGPPSPITLALKLHTPRA